MNPSEKTLTTFETRVRQLILRIQELKKENEVLVAMVSENEQVIADLNAKLSQADRDYSTLKMAKMLEVTDNDMEVAKAKVAKLLRDVNKCIKIGRAHV